MQVIHHRPEIFKGQLDFGTLAMGETRTMNFTLHNDNPVDVRSSIFFEFFITIVTLIFSLVDMLGSANANNTGC